MSQRTCCQPRHAKCCLSEKRAVSGLSPAATRATLCVVGVFHRWLGAHAE